jgi:Ca-activated chloride channel family protein
VPFNVTDKQNRYINDLTKDDIEILEDNKPQEIQSFERQTDMALTIAMLIDISGSQEFTLPNEVAAGKRFFQKVLRPKKDLAAVITFEHESVLVQNLTSNVEKLNRALDDVRVPVMTAVIPGRTGTPPINGGSNIGATAMYDCIYSVSSELLRPEAGRRVIILVTDGDDNDSRVKMKEAIERAWRNEVIIYAIGIGDRFHFNVREDVLKKVTAETGGRAYFPRNDEDLDKAYAQLEEDLRSQNILTYQSLNDARDGSFRTIQVRIKNRKDLTVRHRRGYFAKKEGE